MAGIEVNVSNLLRGLWVRLVLNTARDEATQKSDVSFAGSSRDMWAAKKEIFSAFSRPNSALVIAGPDGLTSDLASLRDFLWSGSHRFTTEIFWFSQGRLLLGTTYVRRRDALQEWEENEVASAEENHQPLLEKLAGADPLIDMLARVELIN